MIKLRTYFPLNLHLSHLKNWEMRGLYIYIYALKDLMRMMVFTPRTARRARARGGDDSVIYDIFR